MNYLYSNTFDEVSLYLSFNKHEIILKFSTGYGMRPKFLTGYGIRLNFLTGYGIRIPLSGAPNTTNILEKNKVLVMIIFTYFLAIN